VTTVQDMTDKPLSIDSSLIHTIEAGLETYRNIAGRPLLNSASLERVEALDLAKQYEAHVVITGAGESGMPENAEQRIANATKMVDIALDKGIAISDIQVDLLVFPISVDSSFGQHYLDAVREIRTKYGPDIHITGGMSNVSFGIPCRSLVNDVFVDLAVDAGADGGIIDPVTRNIDEILNMDRSTKPYGLAKDMLLGQDRNCKNFLRAFRQGELA
ncbi:MAG: methyltetrahydrofolate--corrinoid methyltransferase, partial [Phycisphaeraceae bacterium]|nr:methyltetrahydrofolate--corrinoid methyltransferase [Phycisphaeraceae bacterium]